LIVLIIRGVRAASRCLPGCERDIASDRALLIDPQTSGGLLVAISPERAGEYLSRVPSAVEIGEVIPPAERGIVLV